MANPTVTIAGVDRTNKTAVNTVSIRRTMNDRSSMACELIETAGSYRPSVGNQIIVIQDGVRKFAGLIEDIDEQVIPLSGTAITYRLQCTDFTRLLDWRLYSGSFENQSFYSIVSTIINAKFAAADGVSLSGVDSPGPTIVERLQDGLRPITEWFRKIALATGFTFRIDENKVLRFGAFTTNPAPFSMTSLSANWRDLHIRRRIGDYRNRQYARTEYRVSSTGTVNFTGDGSTRDFFQTEGPFFGTPEVTLDGNPLTVGRFGFDVTGFDVYYDVEGWGIHWIVPDSPPAGGEAIVLMYDLQFSNLSVTEDAAEIAARAAVQGDSGLIEAVHEDRYIDTKEALDARAENVLEQYGQVPTVIEFETDTHIEPLSATLVPGMRLTINLTNGSSNVNGVFLVESMESRWNVAAPADMWFHRVKCIDQEPYGQKTAAPIEKLAEAVRIGPDAVTIIEDAVDDPDSETFDNLVTVRGEPITY